MAHIEKRGKSYRIRASVGYRVDGSQVQPSMTWTPEPGMTQKQIEKELTRQAVLFDEVCKSLSAQSGHIKFSTFVDRYMEEYAATDLRHRTAVGYESLKPRIVNELGHLYLDRITPRQIKAFIAKMGKPGANMRTQAPLSPKTQRNYLSLLSSIFSYAVDMELIQDNPCTNVRPPKMDKSQKKWYTSDEAVQLLDSLESAPLKYRAFFTLAIFCGYRREEMLGFEWSDIDFANRLISVNRASLYTKERGTYTDVPKTEGSKRILKQPQIVFDVLRKLRSEQLEMRLSTGDQWKGSDRLFTTADGAPMHPNTPYAWLKKHCKANGLRFLGVHAFRHLNAALLINEGADAQTVAANLGHSQVSTTLNIYAYEFAESKAAASQAVADSLVSRLKKKAQ
ncbi:MAG: site-specific integrase [Oscillospiraceae bacterium]|nr:site-specific integrase [Oscillospiraceae bacterium]